MGLQCARGWDYMKKRVLLFDYGTHNMVSGGEHRVYCVKKRDGSFMLQKIISSVDLPEDEPPYEIGNLTTPEAFASAFDEMVESR